MADTTATAKSKARRAEERRQRKHDLAARRKADRALCPAVVANVARLQVHHVAEAMRRHGVTEPLTVHQVKTWQAQPLEAPEWFTGLLAEAAAGAAGRAHQEERRAFEREHRLLILADAVKQLLLAGRPIRGHDAEWIALDMAVRGMKELVRSDGDVTALLLIDLAALRWAGVDPADRETWFLRRGGGRADG